MTYVASGDTHPLPRLLVVGLIAAKPPGVPGGSWTGPQSSSDGWRGALAAVAAAAAESLRDARSAGSSTALGVAAAAAAATSVLSSFGVLG